MFVAALAALIPITNPIGAVAAYAGLSAHLDADDRRRQAWRTGIYVAVILAAFAVLGTLILQLLGISLAALQIAGALVVMHSGFGIVVPRDAPPATAPEAVHAATKTDISLSPMALPLIAGPGAIGVVIGIAARNGHPISFWQFTKYGLIVTLVTVTLVTPYLWLRYLL